MYRPQKRYDQMTAAEKLEVWHNRVAGSVHVLRPEDTAEIAKLCLAAETTNQRHASTWHQASVFYGYQHKCNCCPCRAARGEQPIRI